MTKDHLKCDLIDSIDAHGVHGDDEYWDIDSNYGDDDVRQLLQRGMHSPRLHL